MTIEVGARQLGIARNRVEQLDTSALEHLALERELQALREPA